MKAPEIFFEMHALLLVIGGTFAAALVAYPYASLSRTVDYLLWGLLFKRKKEYLKVSQEIAASRNSFFMSQTYAASDEAHPFFREASMFLMNRNIDDPALEEILRNRSEYFRKRYEEDTTVLRSLARYAVSFGFFAAICAVLEMLPLLQSHSGEFSAVLFHGFGSALIGIFWGMALSSILILPVADSAAKASDEDSMLRSLIIDGMVLIRTRATDDHFQAYLRGYLSLADRSEFKIYSKNVIPFKVPPVQKKIEVQSEEIQAIQEPPPTNEVEVSEVSDNTVFPVAVSGHVEASISVASAKPTDLAQFDFKDLKVREARKKFR